MSLDGIKNKSILLYLLVFILLVAGFISYLMPHRVALVSKEFSGVVNHINGNSIFASGFFINNANSISQSSEVEVTVGPNTRFVATVVHAPLADDLKVTDGVWDLSSLKKETRIGSVEELKEKSLIFFAEADQNIFGTTKFEATKINYSIVKYPATKMKDNPCKNSKGEFIGVEACKTKISKTI